jgi:hypothetical protein
VFVRVRDAMNVEKPRRDERARAGSGCGRSFAKQFDFEAAFLARLTQRGLLRVFVQFDVSAERQPLVELAMVDQQDFAVMNDEDGDREINLLVDVGHGGKLKGSKLEDQEKDQAENPKSANRTLAL